MSKITEVLRLKYDARLSHAQIARAVGLSKGAVGKYVSLPTAVGVSAWPLPEGLDEAALERRLFPASPGHRVAVRRAGTGSRSIRSSRGRGVSCSGCGPSTSSASALGLTATPSSPSATVPGRGLQRRSMRQHHAAGDKVFSDHAGPTFGVIDRRTGEVRQAQIFVAVLGASSYTFAEATWAQSLPDWIGSNRRMLEFFGGVPALLVPDNLRSATTTACRYPSRSGTTRSRARRMVLDAGPPVRSTRDAPARRRLPALAAARHRCGLIRIPGAPGFLSSTLMSASCLATEAIDARRLAQQALSATTVPSEARLSATTSS